MGLTNESTWRHMEKPALNTSLLERILSNDTITKAWKQVKSNGGSPGIDGVSVDQFSEYFRPRWKRIKGALDQGYYIPTPGSKGSDTQAIRRSSYTGNTGRSGPGDPASHGACPMTYL